jgi:hypothetical protein
MAKKAQKKQGTVGKKELKKAKAGLKKLLSPLDPPRWQCGCGFG